MSLVADSSGVVRGKFTVPAGVPTGTKLVQAIGAGGSMGTATYTGQGTIERQTFQQQTTITETRWQSAPVFQFTRENSPVDPLAQTFTMNKNIQMSGVDLWFSAAPTTTCRVQIRETTTGIPNSTVRAEAIIAANSVTIDGTATRIPFVAPVGLLAGVEYAIVVLCDDPNGAVWVAELGKYDSNAQKWITSQPYQVGVLLSSSNANTWTPHQDRDMAFRILAANFTENTHTFNLGTVAVTNATDLMVMGYADRPASDSSVQYTLTLPDSSTLTVTDGQPVQLASPITGNVSISATLSGSANFAPVLQPGAQLVVGTIAGSATYVTRAIPAGSNVKIKVILEATIPSGANLALTYVGITPGETAAPIPQISTRTVDNGFTEFVYQVTGITETAVQVTLALSGTTSARPSVRDLRVIIS